MRVIRTSWWGVAAVANHGVMVQITFAADAVEQFRRDGKPLKLPFGLTPDEADKIAALLTKQAARVRAENAARRKPAQPKIDA